MSPPTPLLPLLLVSTDFFLYLTRSLPVAPCAAAAANAAAAAAAEASIWGEPFVDEMGSVVVADRSLDLLVLVVVVVVAGCLLILHSLVGNKFVVAF